MKDKYNGNCEQFGFTTTTNETSGYIDVNSATACTEQTTNSVSYEAYMEVINENALLKRIIVELNKKLYGGQNDR